MPTPGPWKHPAVRRIGRAAYAEDFNSGFWEPGGGVDTIVSIGGTPSSTVFGESTAETITSFNSGGIAVGQEAVRFAQDQYSVLTGFWVLDVSKWFDGSPAAANLFPIFVDTTDPDYIAGDWVDIEFNFATGSGVLTSHNIDFDFIVQEFNSTQVNSVTTSVEALLLTSGSDYVVTDLFTNTTVDLPPLNSGRWSSASVLPPVVSGYRRMTVSLPWSIFDSNLRAGWQFRADGADWVFGPADLDSAAPLGVGSIVDATILAFGYYQPVDYRFLYANDPNLTGSTGDRQVHFWRPRAG